MSRITILDIKPTVFFIEDHKGLLQKIELTLQNDEERADAVLSIDWIGGQYTIKLSNVEQGKHCYPVYIPDIRDHTEVRFTVQSGPDIISTLKIPWLPTKHWEVCFVPITHHDLGYTDTIEDLYEYYAQFYDNVLAYCKETEHFPEEAKYRYTLEQSWSLVNYLQNRPKEIVESFMHYARQGRIEVSAQFANIIDAMCGHEELNRLLYPSFNIRREYAIPVTTASMVDIPGLSWSLPSVLSQAGIKYLFAGFPTYFEWQERKVPSFWDEQAIMKHGRPGAFRWKGPDGASILTYYSGGYGHFKSGITSPSSVDEVLEHLPKALEEMDQNGSPLSVVRYIDHGSDNYPPQRTISYIAMEWNQRFAYPKLIVSTNHMFFEKLEKQCTDVPVIRGEMPHTDYPVGALCAAKETAINRVTHDVLQSAEHLASLSSLMTRDKYPAEKINRAYREMMLFDEHAFGMWQPLGKWMDWNWNTKSGFAYRAAALAQGMLIKSAEHVATHIRFEDEVPHLTVFNPLSYDRSEFVRIHNFSHHGNSFELVDLDTGRTVPAQLIVVDDPGLPLQYASGRYALGHAGTDGSGTQMRDYLYSLVFLAEDLPALGYKSYKLVEKSNSNQSLPAEAAFSAWQLENDFYKVDIDPETGSVKSIMDKQYSRELVDNTAEHLLNQVVIRSVKAGGVEKQRSAKLLKRIEGPVYRSMILTSEAPGCPKVTQEIILYHSVKKIDFVNRIFKDETPFQEVFIAFPFYVERPRFRFEGTNSVIEPFKDQVPGSNTNHYTVQHWAQVRNDSINIVLSPIDSHTLEFGGMWPSRVSHAHHGIAPEGYENPPVTGDRMNKGHIYAFVINSNSRTNFSPIQTSDVIFRFSVTTNQETEHNPFRFGWSNAVSPVPHITKWNNSNTKAFLPSTLQFLSINSEHVFLLAMKHAEDGNGLILRFIEMEGKETNVEVKLPEIPIKRVYLTSNVEENLRLLAFHESSIPFPIGAYGTVTIRIEIGDVTPEGLQVNFFERLAANKSVFLG